MSLKPYNPFDWYWRADDARLFSSAAAAVIQADAPAFLAWSAEGLAPTVWPRDEDGHQTDAALVGVLKPYGVAVPGQDAPAAPVITFKADIFRRCTDDEADMIDAALAQAPTRQRRLFETAQFLDHSAEEFGLLSAAVTGLFGQERAAVLLAASE